MRPSVDAVLEAVLREIKQEDERFKQCEVKAATLLWFTGVALVALRARLLPAGAGASGAAGWAEYLLLAPGLAPLVVAISFFICVFRHRPYKHIYVGGIVTDRFLALPEPEAKARIASTYLDCLAESRGSEPDEARDGEDRKADHSEDGPPRRRPPSSMDRKIACFERGLNWLLAAVILIALEGAVFGALRASEVITVTDRKSEQAAPKGSQPEPRERQTPSQQGAAPKPSSSAAPKRPPSVGTVEVAQADGGGEEVAGLLAQDDGRTARQKGGGHDD